MYNSLPLNIKKKYIFDHSTLNSNNIVYIKKIVKNWLICEKKKKKKLYCVMLTNSYLYT